MNNIEILKTKAEHDFIAIKTLIANPDSPTDIIAFHIQQMLEKLIKCLLMHHQIVFKFSHDLFYLLNLLNDKYPNLNDYEDLMENLNPHAVMNRYDEGFEISWSEVTELFQSAQELRNLLLNYIQE